MVEVARVELASENTPLQASTYLVLLYCLSCSSFTRTRNLLHYPAFISPPADRNSIWPADVVDALA